MVRGVQTGELGQLCHPGVPGPPGKDAHNMCVLRVRGVEASENKI